MKKKSNNKRYVSIWVGKTVPTEQVDILHELIGISDYDLDSQECICDDKSWKIQDVNSLLSQLSYSDSFVDKVSETALKLGCTKARYVLAQYDFVYTPRNKRTVTEPMFLGVFEWFEDSEMLRSKYGL